MLAQFGPVPADRTRVDRPRRDAGFSLLELMVVVLVLSILMSIAIPGFIGGRRRATDLLPRSSLDIAAGAAVALLSESGSLASATAGGLALAEPALGFVDGATASTGPSVLSVTASASTWAAAALSGSGTCYWRRLLATGSDTSGSATGVACTAGSVGLTNPVTSGIAAWFDATDLDGDGSVEGTGESGQTSGAVGTWVDKSANAFSVTQGTAGSQPSYVADGWGSGRPVVRFDGTNDTLSRASVAFTTLVGSGTQATVYVVQHNRTGAQSSPLLVGSGSTSRLNVHAPWTDCRLYVDVGSDYTTGRFASTATQCGLVGSSTVLSFRRDTSTIAAWANGVAVPQYTMTAPAAGAGTAPMYVGSSTGVSYWFGGDIAEILIYNRALTDAERAQVDSYLSTKWLTPESPPVTSGLRFWVDANDLDGDGVAEGTLESGQTSGSVTQWKDRSSTAVTGALGSGSTSPTLVQSGANGRALVNFGPVGSTEYLTFTHATLAALVTSDRTMFAVARANATGGGAQEYVGAIAGWPGFHNGMVFASDAGSTVVKYVTQMQWVAANSAGAYAYALVAPSTLAVLTGTMSSSGGVTTATSGVRGSATGTSTATGAPSAASTVLNLGRFTITTWNEQLDGDIGEVLIYDRVLSGSERTLVEGWLAARWGL